ncbi:MAG: type II toxin-antitoxin system VapC family toxin [Proteobacteria bacterium]|nr:type II toxin-antitoxin system VapC family toxin [Pseudomonadota bacterium]
MKVLLDTHAILWIIGGDDRLSRRAKDLFLDQNTTLYYSLLSIWEITIKMSLGKIKLAKGWLKTIEEELRINAIQPISIEIEHCRSLFHLPFHHRDPFDRMLIAQAITGEMAIMSCDKSFANYDVELIW